jgi:hypothetical protein
MKKTFFLAGVASFLLTLTINAQDTTKPAQTPMTQDTTKPAPSVTTTQPTKQTQPTTQEQKKYANPTVDSILSKYTLVPMPSPVTTEQIFPVIGQYQSSTNADQKLTITLDDQNKGFAWIDGMPQGKVKAILKKSPATYKIPAQKTADGKDVPEGTLIYDKDSKVITVLVGRPFNDQDPASVFATAATTTTDQSMTKDQTTTTNDQGNKESKMTVAKTKGSKTHSKTKVKKVEEPAPWVFTGTKVEQVTATNQ